MYASFLKGKFRPSNGIQPSGCRSLKGEASPRGFLQHRVWKSLRTRLTAFTSVQGQVYESFRGMSSVFRIGAKKTLAYFLFFAYILRTA